jgi:hypothetical protein
MAFDPNNLLHRHYCQKLAELDPVEREALEELTEAQIASRIIAARNRPRRPEQRLPHDYIVLMAEKLRRGLP